MIFNRKRFSILLVFAVFFSFLSPLTGQLASAYTYRDSSITTEEACTAKGGEFKSGYNGSTLESYCLVTGSPSDEAKIVLYAGWLANCIEKEIDYDTSFDTDQLRDNRLDAGGSPIVGHTIDLEDGRMQCGKANNVSSALRGLGYSSLIPLLRDIGCKDSDATISCSGSAASLSDRELYNKFVTHQHKDAGLKPYNQYYIALNTFIRGCDATEIINPTDADLFALEHNTGNIYRIKVLSEDRLSLVDAIYKSEQGKGAKISTINPSVGWEDDGTFTCESLASMVNSYANPYLAFVKLHKTPADAFGNQTNDPADTTSSCVVEGVGWIVCPVLGFLSNITDAIYTLVSSWLTIDVKLFDVDTGTYRGWNAMRNIANIGFVIMFLIVIFSQLTGSGISNYGVKKVLPRLVVTAIAINLSFYITQFMVDISNVVGSSIATFFSSQPVFGNSPEGVLANGNTFTDIIGNLLAGGAVAGIAVVGAAGAIAYGGIGLFIMVILAAIIAVAVTLLILAARQAFIVILIVLAPLAFLAMIFPNTKKWYDNWQKIFVSLLVIYPMVAIVFGASAMAAGILIQSNPILGLAVATIPLFAVIPMLKGSLKAVPIAGNLASKLGKKASLSGNLKAGAKQARTNAVNDMRSRALSGDGGSGVRRASRWLAGGQARGQSRNRRLGANAAKAEASYIAHRALANENASTAEQAAAVSSLHKIDEEEIANVITLDTSRAVDPQELLDRLTSSTATKAEKIAAVRQIEARGGMSNKLAMAKLTSRPELAGEGDNLEIRQSIVSSTAKMGDSNIPYGGKSLVQMQEGTFDATEAHLKHAKSGEFTAKSLLSMHPVARTELLAAIQSSNDPAATAALQTIQGQIDSIPELKARSNSELNADIARAIGGSSTPGNPAPGAGPAPTPGGPAPRTPDVSAAQRARDRQAAAAQGSAGTNPIPMGGSPDSTAPPNNNGTPPAGS